MNTNTSTSNSSPFYLSDTEFAELLWENGQIVTHDHSFRPNKRDTCTSNGNGNGNGNGNANTNPHNKGKNAAVIGLITDTEFPLNNILPADDESMVPWMQMHCSLQDHPLQLQSSPLPPVSPFHADFCSDFFEGFAGTNTPTIASASTQPTAGTTTALPAAASTGISTSTELVSSKGDTAMTNFSLFKERLVSGARASTSTSTSHGHEKINPSQRMFIKSSADDKENTKIRHELVPASSSVCSINDEGIESFEPKHAGKRKIREGDEYSSSSEEMDDESAIQKRVAIGRGSYAKKSRAAEVHNLSERRRRERINEKMRALQQLIPNCSKADKASMLDDAIEYLKSLQLQVQMMSLGNGMYMPPPVIMPPMMQPLRAAHMAHYPPLGMGLYQMGMYPHQFIQGPHPMHGMIAPMPVHPQVPVPTSVNMQPTTVVSSSENAITAATGASAGSTFVKESPAAADPAVADPKAEML